MHSKHSDNASPEQPKACSSENLLAGPRARISNVSCVILSGREGVTALLPNVPLNKLNLSWSKWQELSLLNVGRRWTSSVQSAQECEFCLLQPSLHGTQELPGQSVWAFQR